MTTTVNPIDTQVAEELSDLLRDAADVVSNVDLRPYSSIGIGGTADAVVSPRTKEAIIRTIFYCNEKGIPYYVSGLGANTVFGDIPGVLINTKSLNNFIEPESGRIIGAEDVKAHDGIVIAQAGVVWGRKPAIRQMELEGWRITDADALLDDYTRHPSMAIASYLNNLSGVEGLADVPGTVGAGAFLNAGGGFEHYASQFIEEVIVIDSKGETKTIQKGESRKTRRKGLVTDRGKVAFGYRTSTLQDNGGVFVYAVKFRFTEEMGQEELKSRMFDDYERRLTDIPRGFSVGSVWKRRGEDGMGYDQDEVGSAIKGDQLIMEAGCAGYQHPSGRIIVSPQYPLVLISEEGATIDDFRETVGYVEGRVEDGSGRKLAREVKFLPPL